MSRQAKDNMIDVYLREISPECSNITETISQVAEILGISTSTVARWRSTDCVPRADEIVSIIIAVNKNRPEGKKCNLKDVAILCNYKKKLGK